MAGICGKGLTLVESLVSMALIGVLVVSLLGAFFISRIAASRAKHRLTAMTIVKSHIEQEVRHHSNQTWNDSYITSEGSVLIDDRGSLDASDDLYGTINYYPAPPLDEEDSNGNPWRYPAEGLRYKIFGFQLSWLEDGVGKSLSEKAVAYVAEHPQA